MAPAVRARDHSESAIVSPETGCGSRVRTNDGLKRPPLCHYKWMDVFFRFFCPMQQDAARVLGMWRVAPARQISTSTIVFRKCNRRQPRSLDTRVTSGVSVIGYEHRSLTKSE